MFVTGPQEDLRRSFRRLFQMPWPELACRGRQEALKLIERMRAATPLAGPAPPGYPDIYGAAVRDHPSLEDFHRTVTQRFFKGPLDPRMPRLLLERMPRTCASVVATAETLCRKRFDLLGYRNLDFGDPVDWHLDPVSGRRAPLIHWSRIDPLDVATVGDSKVIWELNRHQWLVALGLAYQLTRNERYARSLISYLRSWLERNPPGFGINWTSSLELALRLIAWCWCLALIRDARVLASSFFHALAASIEAHATHIARYLSFYFSPNTHLTGEALGLLYASLLFPQFRRAADWRRVATEVLAAESTRQVLPDGVYFEQATCYQRYTADIYLHYLILMSRARLPVPGAARERLQQMGDFLLAIRRPDGSMPTIGDADHGWLLPLTRTPPDNLRPLFSTMAVLFGRPEYAWAAGGVAFDTLWLLGTSEPGTRNPTAQVPQQPPSRAFPIGGYVVMRSGWQPADHSLLFDTGPLGCRVSAGHGHADLLSIQCAVFGRPLLVDAGTYCYTPDAQWRDFFRSSAAHSTVTVDGESQAGSAGPFVWRTRPTARLNGWRSEAGYDFADAQHDAYHRLAHPVTHRRRVLFVKPLYWVLVDDLTGSGTHLIEVRFQFAPARLRVEPSLWTRAATDDGRGLFMRAFAAEPLTLNVHTGCYQPLAGWVSRSYGHREPAPMVVYSISRALPVRVITLLWPTTCVDGELPRVTLLQHSDGMPMGLTFPELGERVRFDQNTFALDHDGADRHPVQVAARGLATAAGGARMALTTAEREQVDTAGRDVAGSGSGAAPQL